MADCNNKWISASIHGRSLQISMNSRPADNGERCCLFDEWHEKWWKMSDTLPWSRQTCRVWWRGRWRRSQLILSTSWNFFPFVEWEACAKKCSLPTRSRAKKLLLLPLARTRRVPSRIRLLCGWCACTNMYDKLAGFGVLSAMNCWKRHDGTLPKMTQK